MAKITTDKGAIKGTANVTFSNPFSKVVRSIGAVGSQFTDKVKGFMTETRKNSQGDEIQRVYCVTEKKARFSVDEDQFDQLEVGTSVTLVKREFKAEGSTTANPYFELETINAAASATVDSAATAVTA